MYSPTADKYFTGETNNVPHRIELHNSHKGLKAFTKAACDWKVELIFKCNSKKEAVYLEKYIKGIKSRDFVEKLIAEPQILNDILLKK